MRGGERIVVTEIPFQTSVEGIGAEDRRPRELPQDRGHPRDPQRVGGQAPAARRRAQRDANALVTLNNLYKHTPMQTSFGVNMLALVDGVPRLLDLSGRSRVHRHQIDVITRRTEFRLRKAQERAHIVEGLVKALDMIDAIVALIRGAEDADAARAASWPPPSSSARSRPSHILDMQLRRLTQLEGQKLRDELAELQATIAELQSILDSAAKLARVIKDELGEVRDKFANERQDRAHVDTGELDTLDLIEDEEVVVVLSNKGYIKTVAADAFRRQGRGGAGVRGGNLRDEDYVEHLLTTTAHSYLLFFSNRGASTGCARTRSR